MGTLVGNAPAKISPGKLAGTLVDTLVGALVGTSVGAPVVPLVGAFVRASLAVVAGAMALSAVKAPVDKHGTSASRSS